MIWCWNRKKGRNSLPGYFCCQFRQHSNGKMESICVETESTNPLYSVQYQDNWTQYSSAVRGKISLIVKGTSLYPVNRIIISARRATERYQEKKEEIWLSPTTKAPTPTEMSKGQSDNTNNVTKKFDFTVVADRLRTIFNQSYIYIFP